MLSSITPLGERARGNRWWLTVAAYLAGSLLGGALTGTVAALAGWPLRAAGLDGTALAVLALLLGVAAVAFDASGGRLRLPAWHRQVNEDWMTIYRGVVYGFGWGLQLGMGLVTIVTAATVYLAFALAFLSGTWWFGLAVGATFGLVRGLVVLTAAQVDDPDRLMRYHRGLQQRAPVAQAATVGADLLVVAAATVAVVR